MWWRHQPWWAQIGGLRVFADYTRIHKRKTNAVFYVCLSSCSDRSWCRWYITHMTIYSYLEYRIDLKTPILAPSQDKNGAGSCIPFYICVYITSKKKCGWNGGKLGKREKNWKVDPMQVGPTQWLIVVIALLVTDIFHVLVSVGWTGHQIYPRH